MSLIFENNHSDFKNSSTITVDYHVKKRKVVPLINLESKNLDNLIKDDTINQKANKLKRPSPIQINGNTYLNSINTNSIPDVYMIKRRSPPNKKFKGPSTEGDINIFTTINKASPPQLRSLNNQTTTTTSAELSSLISSKCITIPKGDDSTNNLGSSLVDSNNFKKTVNTMKKVVDSSHTNTTSSNPNMYNPHQQNINEIMLNNKYKILPHIIIKESKHGNLTIPVLPSFLTDRT